VIEEPRNRGKGAAVRDGMLKARGVVRLFMDADGSYAPSEIENQLHFFHEGYDVVLGSRFVTKSAYDDAAGRRFIRGFFRLLVSLFLFRGIRDTQCGFKLFTARAAEIIFPEIRLRGFGFDLETIYVAFKKKLSVKEAPVRCTAQEGSKVRIVRDSLTLFADIFRIRFFH
jgi:dolichyl-phosphate beta-glucosyltransferase